MNQDNYTNFKVRRGGKNVGIFFAAFSFFPIMGVIAIVAMGTVFPGILVVGFGILILGYMLFRHLALGWKYGVGIEGVLLKAHSTVRELSFDELESISVPDKETLEKFLELYSRAILSSTRSMNLKKWHKSSKQLGELTRFASVVVTETQGGRSGPMGITSMNVYLEGQTVILKTKSNEYFLVTPENCEGFSARVRDGGVEEAPVDGYHPGIVDDLELNTSAASGNAGNQKRIRVMSLITFTLIVGAFLTWFFLSRPGDPDFTTGGTDASQTAAEIDGEVAHETPPMISQGFMGFWKDDSNFVLSVSIQTIEELYSGGSTQAGYEVFREGEVVMALRFIAADAMYTDFVDTTEKVPVDFDRESLANYLFSNSSISYLNKLEHESGVFEVFSVTGNSLKKNVEQTFRESIQLQFE
jgi:hypothetical protein